MAWITKKLKELGTIVGGGTPSTKHPEYYTSNGIGWITPKDLSGYRGRFISHGERDISSDGLAHSSARLMPKGTVLFSSRAPIGYVAIAGNDLCTNQGFKSIVPNESTDSVFLYYLMLHNASKIEAIAGGSTFKEVSGSVLGDFSVMVPDSLDEQRSIASVLSSLDRKIELNNKINDNLSKQISTLIAHEFPYTADEFISGWHMVNLTEVASFTNGYSYKSDDLKPNDDVALVTIKNFDRYGGFKLDGFKELIPSSRVKPERYADLFDILVAHTDLTQNAEVIGNSEVVLSKGRYGKLVFSMDLVCVKPIGNFGKFLLAALLHDRRFKKHCLGYVNGTTVLHLNKNALKEYCFLVPDDPSILCKLDLLLGDLYRKQSEIIEENIRLSETRDLLLKKLLSGETESLDSLER